MIKTAFPESVYYISEDFSKETFALQKDLWKEVKTLREEG